MIKFFKGCVKAASLLLAFTALLPSTANAWGTEGHQVIALIAQANLTPRAQAEVEKLLALEPGATLASISTWADEHRSPATAPWHYVNFPRDTCTYMESRDCPDGRCVVGAIQRQMEVLSSDAPDEKRLTALKYLVHFVGDVHQPLHAGYADDRGGNTYQLQVLMRGTNLHALWDRWLIDSLDESPEVLARRLIEIDGKSVVGKGDAMAVDAAEESCRIVGREGFYPDRKADGSYFGKFSPVLEQRLVVAGRRLASLLNQSLR